MKREDNDSSSKKNIDLSLNNALAEEVRKHNQNIWLKENKQAIESSNKFVEEHGLPLDSHRKF